MHPAIAHWQRVSRCGTSYCAPRGGDWQGRGRSGGDGDAFDDGGSSFGVRRPLRFLAYKLELDDRQVAELARIINALKTERAQAEVDRRRTVTALADAVAGDSFQEQHTDHAGQLRAQSAERLQLAITRALKEIHAVLNSEQRARFAYLIRSGTLSL